MHPGPLQWFRMSQHRDSWMIISLSYMSDIVIIWWRDWITDCIKLSVTYSSIQHRIARIHTSPQLQLIAIGPWHTNNRTDTKQCWFQISGMRWVNSEKRKAMNQQVNQSHCSGDCMTNCQLTVGTMTELYTMSDVVVIVVAVLVDDVLNDDESLVNDDSTLWFISKILFDDSTQYSIHIHIRKSASISIWITIHFKVICRVMKYDVMIEWQLMKYGWFSESVSDDDFNESIRFTRWLDHPFDCTNYHSYTIIDVSHMCVSICECVVHCVVECVGWMKDDDLRMHMRIWDSWE